MTLPINRTIHFKMTRSLIESLIDKSLKDIETNPFRGSRNLVDIGLYFSNSRFQKQIFQILQDVLSNVNSPYYKIVEKTVLSTNKKTLKQFGANVGYNSWTYGASIIREKKSEENINIPWTILYNLPKEMINKNFKIISKYIEEEENLGIYTNFIFPEIFSEQYEKIFYIASKYKNSSFIIFDRFNNISIASLNKFQNLNNTMIVPVIDKINIKESKILFNMLQSKKMLYGLAVLYNDKNYLEITKNDFLIDLEAFKSPLLFFLPEKNINYSPKTEKHIQNLKSDSRRAIKYSYFIIDLFNDIKEIDYIISKNKNLLEINGLSIYKNSTIQKIISH